LKKPADGDGFRPLRADEYIQMAGRAGRRGKDTQGLVMYMPSRQPLEADELRGCLTGSMVPLESRLQFHYDFILKALLVSQKATDAKPLWETLVTSSYWEQQRTAAIQRAKAECTELQSKQTGVPILPSEREEFAARTELVKTVKSSANAAKRKAQTALDMWNDRHMGPKWTAAAKVNEVNERLETQIQTIQRSISALSDSVFATRIAPVFSALRDWNALKGDEKSPPALTEFGILATEVNEANPLLVAKLYASGSLADASCEEIVAVLGSLIVDRESLNKTVHPRALSPRISERVKDILIAMDAWCQQGIAIDGRHGVKSPEMFWSLTTLWVEIGHDWLNGVSAAELTKRYEIYEGNLMRGLLKLMNIVNEWITVATYKTDVRMLETLKNAQNMILRDIAQPESLYLRLN
jgi:superfamily II RNA helicase